MNTITLYKQHSFLYTSSSDKILLRNNCDLLERDTSERVYQGNENNTSTTLYTYNTIKLVNIVYIIHDKESVEKFLMLNSNLAEFLLEAHIQIECRFGDVPLFLQLHTDYENSEWTKLFLIIKSNLADEEASETLEDLFKKWFFKQEKRIRKLVTISEE